MLRPILTVLLLSSTLISAAQAGPRLVLTRHVLEVDVHDLDPNRDAGQLRVRIALAADQVCGGRPDRGNRYTQDEIKVLLPAYDRCRADAIGRALAPLHLPAELAKAAGR